MRLSIKECTLEINGVQVVSDDALIRLASDLSLGDIPFIIENLHLTTDEIALLEEYLEQNVLLGGLCDKKDEEDEV